MKKSKIMLYIVLLGLLTIQLTGCKKSDKDVVSYPKIYDYLNSITLDAFNERVVSNGSFIVYIARPSCSDCEILDERIISDITKNNGLKNISYLNISPIYNDKEKWNEFKNKYGIEGTPSFISFKNGQASDVYGWTEENGFNYEQFIIWNDKLNNFGS